MPTFNSKAPHMNLVWLQVIKDVRMTRALLIMFGCALLADLAGCQGWIGEPDWVWPNWSTSQGFGWQSLIPQCAFVFGAMLILTVIVQDTPARENGFLHTRPMPARSIWIGKLIFVFGFVLAPAWLEHAAHLLLSGVAATDFAGILQERVLTTIAPALLIAGASACAISASGLQVIMFALMLSFAIGMALLGGYSAITHYANLGLPYYDPTPTSLRLHGAMAIGGCALLMISRWMAHSRPTVLKATVVVGCAGVGAMMAMAAFPADVRIQPIAQSEVEAFNARSEFSVRPGSFGLGNWMSADETAQRETRFIDLSLMSPELPADWSVESDATRFTFTAEDGSQRTSVIGRQSRSYFSRQLNPPIGDLRAIRSLLPEVKVFDFPGFYNNQRDKIDVQGGWIKIPNTEPWWSQPVRIEASPELNYYRWELQANLPLATRAEQRDATGLWRMEASHYNTNSIAWEFVLKRTQVWRKFSSDPNQSAGRWWPADQYRFLIFDPETRTAAGFDSLPHTILETGRHQGAGSAYLEFGQHHHARVEPLELGDPMKFRLLILKRTHLGTAATPVVMHHRLDDLRPVVSIEGRVGESRLSRPQVNRRFAELTAPPTNAGRPQVAQYVSSVLQLLIASRTYPDRTDAMVQMLGRYVPNHLPLFLDGLEATSGPAERALEEALHLRLTRSQLPGLVARLRRDPSLCGFITHHGWLADARDEILALTDHPRSLDQPALQALAMLSDDPRALARLQVELESGNQMAAFELLERDPAMRPLVDRVVTKLWSRHVPIHRDSDSVPDVTRMAARCGLAEAHQELLNIFRLVANKNRSSSYSLLEAITECTDLPGLTYRDRYNQQKVAVALSKVINHDFRFDQTRRRFVPQLNSTDTGDRQ